MPAIKDFTAQEFRESERSYYLRLNKLKERVLEICSDFCKINQHRHIEDIDIYEDDENVNEYYVFVTFTDSDRFVFPAVWLNSDEYKEAANKVAEKIREKERHSQYAEYLRLKNIFEN